MNTHLRFNIVALVFLFAFSYSSNAKDNTLKDIIALPTAPDGVVIEIVTGDESGLTWALPIAQQVVNKLQQRFNNLSIVIVTHGREEFALLQQNQSRNSREHNTVRTLMKDNNVLVHVCGTHASWRGLSDQDFPDYVNVSETGPAQINDYKALGFLLLVIRSKDFPLD